MNWQTIKDSLGSVWVQALIAGLVTHLVIFFLAWVTTLSTVWMWEVDAGMHYRLINWLCTLSASGITILIRTID